MDTIARKQKLKVKDIIDDLDENAIKAFILQYSKNDASFEIAFKAHFISRIRTGINENTKYKRILDEIIKPRNANNQKISQGLKKTISLVLKDLVLQMNDCLSTDNFTEAYSLIKESLQKIEYLQHRYFIKDASVERCRVQFLIGLSMILDMELAPAFRSKMEKELKELIVKSYFFPQKDNLIELLNDKNTLVEEDKKNVIESLLSKQKKAPDLDNLIKTVVQLAYPFNALAQEAIFQFGKEKVFQSLKELIQDRKFTYVDFYLDNKSIQFDNKKQILTILKLIEKQEFQAISSALLSVNIATISIVDLRAILDALPEAYLKKEFKKIRKWVDKLGFGLKTNLYFRAGYHSELISFLDDKNDVEWIKVYDTDLLKVGYNSEIATLYHSTVDNYIADHLGTQARDYLTKIQQHLYKIGHPSIAEELLRKITKKYSHRISLN